MSATVQLSRPNIQLADDLSGFDHVVPRLVDKMLEAIAVDWIEAANFKTVADHTRGSARNPISQKRLYKRLVKAYGRTLLASDLKTGKNQFRAIFDSWIPIPADDALGSPNPQLSWLAAMRCSFQTERKLPTDRGIDDPRKFTFTITPLDPKKAPENRSKTAASQRLTVITRHALERLVQRAECRTPEDLIAILHKVWPMILLAFHASHEGKDYPGPDAPGWIIPVRLSATSPIVYFVLRKYVGNGGVYDDWELSSVIATILSADMIDDHSVFHDLSKLLAKDPLSNAFEITERDRAPLLAAFRRTAMATHAWDNRKKPKPIPEKTYSGPSVLRYRPQNEQVIPGAWLEKIEDPLTGEMTTRQRLLPRDFTYGKLSAPLFESDQ